MNGWTGDPLWRAHCACAVAGNPNDVTQKGVAHWSTAKHTLLWGDIYITCSSLYCYNCTNHCKTEKVQQMTKNSCNYYKYSATISIREKWEGNDCLTVKKRLRCYCKLEPDSGIKLKSWKCTFPIPASGSSIYKRSRYYILSEMSNPPSLGGVSFGSSPVNSGAKYFVSTSLLMLGTKVGGI